MPKLGFMGKAAIAIFVLFVLVVVGLFFPVPSPHVVLPANYGDPGAEPFLTLGPFHISNTMFTAWLSILVLAGIFYAATRKMSLVPKGLQNLVETVIEMLANFVEGVAGKENGRRFFPVIATIFLFVIMNAWLSLLPGFSTIGFGEVEEYEGAFFGHSEGFVVGVPLLRAANTDINFPLALALMSFIFVEYCGISTLGFFRYGSKFIRVGELRGGIGQLLRGKVRPAMNRIFTGAIAVFVGGLEAISEFVRIVSFTFRLFGNMTAGEVLLMMMAFLIPWIAAVPFYGLELILGFVQALIFGGLTLVFATVAVTAHSAEHE